MPRVAGTGMRMRQALRGLVSPRALLPWAAVALAALLAWDVRTLVLATQFNAAVHAPALTAGEVPAPVSRLQSGLLLFVHGRNATRDGRLQEALSLYKEAAGDPDAAVAAHYNSGNIHLRDALELAAKGALQQSPQSVELAKQQYRDALRSDPMHWPSKYNLERALWLAPELPDERKATGAPENSERAIATMRGFTLGLP